MFSRVVLALAFLSACADSGTLQDYPIPPLTMTVLSPTYGEFTGNTVTVTGTVSPLDAVVLVEGEPATINDDGTFTITLPYEKPYRILDIEASYRDEVLTDRFPTFWGQDPLLSWPGAITGRLTKQGVEGLSTVLEGLVATLVTDTLLGDLGGGAPLFEVAGFSFGLEGVTLGDIDVDLVPGANGLAASFTIKDVVVGSMIRGDLFGNPVELPADLVFPSVTVDATADVGLDAQKQIVFRLTDIALDLDVPEIRFAGADLGWLSDLLESFIDIEALIDQALGGQLDALEQEIPLGGPIAFETDLLGTQLALELNEVDTDALGIAFGLGVGLGGPIPDGASEVPVPTGAGAPPTDLIVAVHDGLLQSLVKSDLLSIIEQDLQLPGFIGGFLTPLLENLPGGGFIPENAGWCVNIAAGEARVARFGVGEGPLAGIYLPDARVTFSTIATDGSGCVPWLTTSLAMELYLKLDGTEIGFDVAIPEGIVLDYASPVTDTEGLVEQLGEVVQSILGLATGLLGGSGGGLGIDLADILGGLGDLGLDGLTISVGNARPFLNNEGQPIDGMVELSIGLFGESPN